MKNAKILMLPEEGKNENILSTNNIARIISTYQNLNSKTVTEKK